MPDCMLYSKRLTTCLMLVDTHRYSSHISHCFGADMLLRVISLNMNVMGGNSMNWCSMKVKRARKGPDIKSLECGGSLGRLKTNQLRDDLVV